MIKQNYSEAAALPFYFVKNGEAACTIVYSDRPFPPEIYEEVPAPEPVSDISERQYTAICGLVNLVRIATGVELPLCTEKTMRENDGARAFLGKSSFSDSSWLGETCYNQYVLTQRDGNLFTMAWTPGGLSGCGPKGDGCAGDLGGWQRGISSRGSIPIL